MLYEWNIDDNGKLNKSQILFDLLLWFANIVEGKQGRMWRFSGVLAMCYLDDCVMIYFTVKWWDEIDNFIKGEIYNHFQELCRAKEGTLKLGFAGWCSII